MRENDRAYGATTTLRPITEKELEGRQNKAKNNNNKKKERKERRRSSLRKKKHEKFNAAMRK